LTQFPEVLKGIFSSGITTGGLTAIVANALIHIEDYADNKEEA
jgi:xanthine permease XanP